jgi:hypothetical protein
MTYNFRYDSKPDNISVEQTIEGLPKGLPETPSAFYTHTEEQPWSIRRIGIANDILFPKVDILGIFIHSISWYDLHARTDARIQVCKRQRNARLMTSRFCLVTDGLM